MKRNVLAAGLYINGMVFVVCFAWKFLKSPLAGSCAMQKFKCPVSQKQDTLKFVSPANSVNMQWESGH